ncbi:hypothetical protein A1O1_07634 [Capronia coronata CBS 617.96]|uniref:Amino acid permease/ SLC12A domain-containing protein n=1 Tax=Capronia coronata CBS 617.96 TaxID=1182541 RepID=W9XW43_9EURO|nr:uncharacterized protein A1O1_07634 [Capronia coronata CBS 617.96]EXJ81570.1 hypothetical protein A1O1_07634 [Capronia coronata CBS 617.96]
MDEQTTKAPAQMEVSQMGTGSSREVDTHRELRRGLKRRHVSMFALACAVGTGLIIGSGTALTRGGPGSMLIAYILVGIAVFFIMTALGEMATFVPMSKGFSGYATRMVDPAFGFATGWNYYFHYIISIPSNLTAAGLIIQFWRPDLNVAIWITIFGVVIVAINVLHVQSFGESEFWFSIIKVLTMTVLILTCLIISLGGNPHHDRIGFRYWNAPGAFAQHLLTGNTGYFLGFWACMCQACFAYAGTEVVGMTFGEIPNPKKNIPHAVKQSFYRIVSFYVVGVFVLGMAVPYSNEQLVGATKHSTSAAASPFVVAITLAGINVFPDIINAALLVFVISAASSDIYCASRCVYGLAKDGQAPRILSRTLANGSPIIAVILSSLFILLGYMNTHKSTATVFQYFVSLMTVLAVLNWIAILLSYIAFRRALKVQGIAINQLPYIGILQPYGAYYALFISVVVVIFQGYNAFIPHFDATTFVLQYLGIVLFVGNVILWKIYKRTRRVRARDLDLVTGRQEIDAVEIELEEEKKGFVLKRMLEKVRSQA